MPPKPPGQDIKQKEKRMNPRDWERIKHWEAIEARFQYAKLALLEAQEQHCEAAEEFQQARAELRQVLEDFFPGPPPEEDQKQVQQICGCNRAAETLTRCNFCTSGEVYSGDKLFPLTAH